MTQPSYGSTVEEGQRFLDRAVSRDPTVKFLIQEIEKRGCSIGRSFFSVRKCEEDAAGGFMPGEGVILCANHVGFQEEVNSVLAHELVHAYDHCRAANLDWSNLEHHACSEIRAANLSTQCHLNKELLTTTTAFTFRNGHKVCVMRKAQLSVAMNPALQVDAASAQLPFQSNVGAAGAAASSLFDAPSKLDANAAAHSVVERMWDRCYSDTSPFERIP